MLGVMCLLRLCLMMRGVIGISLTFISIWLRPALVRRPFSFLGLGCRAGVPAVAGWIFCRLPVAGVLVSVLIFVARADIFFLIGNCRD